MATLLQIDLQYLFNASRNENQRVDFEKVWQHFNDRESEILIDAIVYMIQNPDFDMRKFETKIRQIGYKTKIKTTSKARSFRYVNQDVNISIDCIKPRFDIEQFERDLRDKGYDTRVKLSSPKSFNYINHDVNIAIDCLSKIQLFDKLILMSGNENFAELAEYVRKMGKTVELWAYKNSYSSKLEPHINRINFLSEDFYYKKPVVEVFGFNKGNR